MAGQFVHLHLHTDYSPDGACPLVSSSSPVEALRRSGELVAMALEQHSPAFAVTDFHSISGAVELFEELETGNVKPIIGCEMTLLPQECGGVPREGASVSGASLVLLAQDSAGYENLCRIVSRVQQHGETGGKGIGREFLAEHCRGLIAMSGGLRGELAVSILRGESDAAEKVLGKYLEIFGKENFFLEVMDHGLEEEKTVNRGIVVLSRKFGIPMVATNEVRYLRKDQAIAAEVLACLRNRTVFADPNWKPQPPEYYYKSYDEMASLFGTEIPEALSNTVRIAERCDFQFDFQQKHYPAFPVPDGMTESEFLREICLRNVPERFGFSLDNPPPGRKEMAGKIRSCLDRELTTIDRIRDSGLYLRLHDLLREMREQGIPVGGGRGAEAGSLVAYLTGITGVDPFRFHLSSERALNPERPYPLGVEIEVGDRFREAVFEIVSRKFGAESVAWTANREIRSSKTALREASRVFGVSPSICSRIEKLVLNGSKFSAPEVYRENPKFQELLEKDDRMEKLIQAAFLISGLKSSSGVSDSEIVAGDRKLDSILPVICESGGMRVALYDDASCKRLGLLNLTFVGQRVLTFLSDVQKQIRRNRGIELNTETIPLDDSKTFDLLSRGDTLGVFQMEGGGMQSLCRQFGVESIEHIIALISLYRPGPMEFIPSFIARKRGEEKIEYDHPKLEPILRETYGLMVYQEQILEVFHTLAGVPCGRAELFRRAIGKHKITDQERYREEFIHGCAATSGIPQERAEELWEKICRFVAPAFQKAHSSVYAQLVYRTAYLKANYPEEFFAALLAGEEKNSDRIPLILKECRERNIAILPPDVNAGNDSFVAEGRAIRCGLSAIRGLRKNVCEAIFEARRTGGPYLSLVDFLERTDGTSTPKTLELLIRAGAFDSLGVERSRLFAVIAEAVACAADRKNRQESGQGGLFDLAGNGEGFSEVTLPDLPEWEERELRENEKQLLGFECQKAPADSGEEVSSIQTESEMSEPGRDAGAGDSVPSAIAEIRDGRQMELELSERQCNRSVFEDLKALFRNYSGEVPVLFCVKTEKGPVVRIEAAREFWIAPSKELTAALEGRFGKGCCRMAELSTESSESPASGTTPLAAGRKEGVDLP